MKNWPKSWLKQQDLMAILLFVSLIPDIDEGLLIILISGLRMESVRSAWRSADAVCFDVDSTVIQEEAIDELANFCGKGEQVKQL
jgi:hypothetical protein